MTILLVVLGVIVTYVVFSYVAMIAMIGNPFKGSDIADHLCVAMFFMAPILVPRMLLNQFFK